MELYSPITLTCFSGCCRVYGIDFSPASAASVRGEMSRDTQNDAPPAQPEEASGTTVAMSFLTSSFRALSLLDRWRVAEAKDQPEAERPLRIISLDEVAWHDTLDDCWLVVCDYVYDCTDFLGSHPGGQDVLLEYAGRDATLAFIGSGHSQHAKRLLEKFLIGELPPHERIFRTPNGIKVGDFD